MGKANVHVCISVSTGIDLDHWIKEVLYGQTGDLIQLC